MVNVGDRVTVKPETFEPARASLLNREDRIRRENAGVYDHLFASGTVVYVHPQGRYYTVEFETFGRKFCESFHMMDTPERYARMIAEIKAGKKAV